MIAGGDFKHSLTDPSLDRVLRGCRVFTAHGWKPPSSVRFDLASVEFAEFGAATRFLVLVEGLVRQGWEVTVRLPDPERRGAETRFAPGGLVARRKCRSFLDHIGFVQSLSLRHLSEVAQARISIQNPGRLLQRGKEPGPRSAATAVGVGGYSVRNYPKILPLRWLSAPVETDAAWQSDVTKFLHNKNFLMTYTDADALVKVVLKELVDNVRDHASEADGPPFAALFGALSLSRSNYRLNPENFYPFFGGYVDWLSQQTGPIVRVIVADSGQGLCSSLMANFRDRRRSRGSNVRLGRSTENIECALFAFETVGTRHSKGDRRGVGLAKIRRFVRSYSGSVTARTGNICAGYEFREGLRNRLGEPRLAYAPGTSIEAFLGYALRARQNREKRHWGGRRRADLLLHRVQTSAIEAGIASSLLEAVETASVERPIVVLACRGWSRDREFLRSLGENLETLAERLRGSAGLVAIFDSASHADCASTFDPLDGLREADGAPSEAAPWVPPFLVVSADGHARWVGASTKLRGVMYRLLEGHQVREDGNRVSGLSRHELDYLATERDWLEAGDEGQYRLCASSEEIDKRFEEDLRELLGSVIDSVPDANV